MIQIPPDVITAAQDSEGASGIPASVTIAQWAVESGWGAHCTGTFNYFGIKAAADQPATACTTHEVVNGQRVAITALFANYLSMADAFTAHANLLAVEPQYATARDYLPDAEAFVMAMAPVYATDPNYAKLILEIMADHSLTQYDGGQTV